MLNKPCGTSFETARFRERGSEGGSPWADTGEGYEVVRLWNGDILGNLGGVLESIVEDSPAESGSPVGGQRYTIALTLSRRGRGDGKWRHERMAYAVPLLVLRALVYVENDLVKSFSSFAGPDSSG